MSSRLHNKWHRHNHHTTPVEDVNFPDAAHDPIASYDSPFQGDFVLNGALSASGNATLAGNPALTLQGDSLALQANGDVTVTNIADVNVISTNTIRMKTPSRSFPVTPVTNSGNFLVVNIDGQDYYIRLWIG